MDPNQQVSPPAVSQQSVITPTPHGPNMMFLLLGGLLLLVIGLGGGYFLANNKEKPVPSNTQQIVQVSPTPQDQQPINTPTPTINDATVNWKTYTSKDNTYTIKFPLDIFVQLICPNEELTLTKRSVEKEESTVMPTCARDGRYIIEVITLSKPAAERKSDEYYSVIKESIVVDGISAEKYTTTLIKEPLGPATEFSQDIYVPYKGKIYQLHLGNKDLMPMFDTMLSTFKFMN